MKIIETLAEMKEEARANLRRDAEVGFVPTMGCLHEGHLSLVRRARMENDVVALSVFVNPTQFGPGEDFDKYPRTWEDDLAACAEEGVDFVFAPSADEMYTKRFQTTVHVENLTKPLCGMTRGRSHFAGVCTVVAKLFHLVRPTRAYFGQKDAQQAVVVQRMVLDLNFPVEIAVCPIVREEDGLALSSRNRYLEEEQRSAALALRAGLVCGREAIRDGMTDADALVQRMMVRMLEGGEVDVEYVHVVSPETLQDVAAVEDIVLLAGAIRVGETRLIDNILVGPDGPWED